MVGYYSSPTSFDKNPIIKKELVCFLLIWRSHANSFFHTKSESCIRYSKRRRGQVGIYRCSPSSWNWIDFSIFAFIFWTNRQERIHLFPICLWLYVHDCRNVAVLEILFHWDFKLFRMANYVGLRDGKHFSLDTHDSSSFTITYGTPTVYSHNYDIFFLNVISPCVFNFVVSIHPATCHYDSYRSRSYSTSFVNICVFHLFRGSFVSLVSKSSLWTQMVHLYPNWLIIRQVMAGLLGLRMVAWSCSVPIVRVHPGSISWQLLAQTNGA